MGKRQIALSVVARGHRLVADDVIMVTRKGEGILMGSGTDLVKHFMEVRGLGLIDIRSMFGIRAIRFQKRVEVIVQLEEWDEAKEYTRTGLDAREVEILGVPIPHVLLPIFPGKNVTVISEVIALNYLLRHYGYDAAMEFSNRLQEKLDQKSQSGSDRVIDWFEHDFE
jgi:HPr kinase/phosphorylase